MREELWCQLDSLSKPHIKNMPQPSYHYGRFFEFGLGGCVDSPSHVTSWFKRAANNNNTDAQYELGKRYASGDTVPFDLKEARTWLVRAASRGHEEAKSELTEVHS